MLRIWSIRRPDLSYLRLAWRVFAWLVDREPGEPLGTWHVRRARLVRRVMLLDRDPDVAEVPPPPGPPAFAKASTSSPLAVAHPSEPRRDAEAVSGCRCRRSDLLTA
jgi:hypothetical protein